VQRKEKAAELWKHEILKLW